MTAGDLASCCIVGGHRPPLQFWGSVIGHFLCKAARRGQCSALTLTQCERYGAVVLATSPTITSPTITGALGSNLDFGTSNAMVNEITNAVSTGTTLNKLAKLTGAPSTAVIASTSDVSGI